MSTIIGYESYTTYVAVKNHFKNEKFNYFRHRGAKVSEGSFKRHKDRYWFVKLQERYTNDELLDFFLAQFTANHLHTYWVGESFGDECQKLCIERKKRMSQFTRFVGLEIKQFYESDLIQLYTAASGYPKIITSYLGGRISLETMIVLNRLNGWCENTDALVGIVGAPLKQKLIKYEPFLNYNIVPIRNKYNDLLVE